MVSRASCSYFPPIKMTKLARPVATFKIELAGGDHNHPYFLAFQINYCCPGEGFKSEA